ncbi:MAG: hypothetical protein ACRBCT_04700 [Alphaproteobacteria bacterium]
MDPQQRELVEKIIEWRHTFVANGLTDETKELANDIAQGFEERYENGTSGMSYFTLQNARNFYDVAGNDAAQAHMETELENYNFTGGRTLETFVQDMMASGNVAEAAGIVAIWEDPKNPDTPSWKSIQDDLQGQGFQNAALSDLQYMFARAHSGETFNTQEPAQVMVADYQPDTPKAELSSMMV